MKNVLQKLSVCLVPGGRCTIDGFIPATMVEEECFYDRRCSVPPTSMKVKLINLPEFLAPLFNPMNPTDRMKCIILISRAQKSQYA